MHGKRAQKAPCPAAKPQDFSLHGKSWTDEYRWLQDAKNPEVLSYLKAENAYAEKSLDGAKRLQAKLYKEIRARVKENDMSVPVKDGPYLYYTRTKKGKEYAIHCRKRGERGKEEIILDENLLAKDSDYFSLGASAMSPDHTLLAYTIDTKGAEDHTLFIKNIATGELLSDRIESVGDIEWSADGTYLFYTQEEHPHPPRKVFRHKLGSSEPDALIFEEENLQWYVGLGKSRSKEYIFIGAGNYTTSEVRFLKADTPLEAPRLVAKRTPKVRYSVEHHSAIESSQTAFKSRGGFFYIATNERAVNFKIMRTPVDKPEKKYWKTWLPHTLKRSIVGFTPFKNFLVLTIREEGSEEIYISSPDGEREKVVFPEDGHTITLWGDIEYESNSIRITYDSFITPKTAFDYDVEKKTFTVRKRQEVPYFHKTTYASKRIWVKSDGVRIPVVLAYKKNVKKKAPLLLEAYGSYGITNDPHFSVARLSLLERGWVIAVAHPRGGGEMGWHWHKEAHLLTKHRTADDFIAVAKKLVKDEYTTRERLAITGGSAGGMLMGQVLNKNPELFGAAVVYVPAADLVTSLLDESLGGTRLHYDEIGDPRIPRHFRYIMTQSPYETVRAVDYPSVLVRASMHDIRTPYWEAAKWVARLREKKTDTNPLLFKVETDGGHFGKSGRYEWIKQRAFDYAFLIDTMASGKKARIQ